jgi:hypothetical protein
LDHVDAERLIGCRHFVFEDGKGRVDVATDEEQVEFGGEWGKRVCHSSFDE